jgi:hypothetical protein
MSQFVKVLLYDFKKELINAKMHPDMPDALYFQDWYMDRL